MPKTRRGRPKGAGNYYIMKNGVFSKEDLYLYAPEDTLPRGEVNRFLQQCDNMLSLLDARTVNSAELEEIAKVYREGVIVDAIFRGLMQNQDQLDEENGVADGTIALDSTTINSLDKILKTVEKRKENLSVRAKDRQDARNLSSQVTLIDVIASVGKESDSLDDLAKKHRKELEEESKNLTDTEYFMKERTGTSYDDDDEEENIVDDLNQS